MATFFHTATMVTEECCNCGILFGLTEDKQARLRQTGNSFYCPNGHSQVYSKPEIQKLRDELIREKSALEQSRALANDLQEKNSKMHGKLSRLHKRIKNGVCPCCNRHFANLENHMKTKHKTGAKKN